MGLLNTLLPNSSADSVAIFDQNFQQVFSGARPMKAIVKETKKVMEHPVETGIVITDDVVIQAIEIELSLMIMAENYRSVYSQIKNLYLKSTLLTVQTRTATYDNMLLSDIPHEENPEFYDAITMAMKLKQVQFVTAQFGTLPASKVANKTNASTKDRGQQQGIDTAKKPKTSAIISGVDGVADWFSTK